MSQPRFRVTSVVPLLLLCAFAAPPAFGLAQRTFVASYGNDANPCSLALPCRAFSFAIAQVIPGGEVIVLDSAGYGPVTITQSVSLIAPAGMYAGISVIPPANTVGVTINGAGITVVLQNLAINALGGTYGIQVLQAANVDVNGCAVSNFVGAGIYVTAGYALNVRDTLVRDNKGPGAYGIWLAAPERAVLERVQVVRSNSDGIHVEAGAAAVVRGSVVAGNGGSGIGVNAAAGLVSTITVEDSLVVDNVAYGIASSSTAAAGAVTQVSAARNTITRNSGYGVSVSAASPGSAIATLADNVISQQGLDGVWVAGTGAVVTASNNMFSNNGTSALHAVAGGTIHTVKGADGLPNNSGEQTTPTIGNVVPANAF
jgi:hypothetical protein